MIHFYKPIRLQIGRSMREQPDIHARLMSHYPQGVFALFPFVVDLSYHYRPWLLNDVLRYFYSSRLVLFLHFWCVKNHRLTTSESGIRLTEGCTAITFVFACVCIEIWPTGMTIWALIVALGVCELCLECVYNYHASRLTSAFAMKLLFTLYQLG